MNPEELESIETPFLAFKEQPNPGRKTKIVFVFSKRKKKANLGTIKWYGQWRQYVFHPAPNTLFNRTCLTDIESVLAGMNSLQRRTQ